MIKYFQKNYNLFNLLKDDLIILHSKGLKYVDKISTNPVDLAAIEINEKDINKIRKQS